MSQFSNMRDVRGYHAYLRLRRGWRTLSLALFGMAIAPLLLSCYGPNGLSQSFLMLSLGCGVWGALLAASGTLTGWFRKHCLWVAGNFALLLAAQGSTNLLWGLPWLSLLTGLWMVERSLRAEFGFGRGPCMFPPGCLLGLVLVPFLWPIAVFFATVFLCVYLVFSYSFLAGAMPRPNELLAQLEDFHQEAMDPITRI